MVYQLSGVSYTEEFILNNNFPNSNEAATGWRRFRVEYTNHQGFSNIEGVLYFPAGVDPYPILDELCQKLNATQPGEKSARNETWDGQLGDMPVRLTITFSQLVYEQLIILQHMTGKSSMEETVKAALELYKTAEGEPTRTGGQYVHFTDTVWKKLVKLQSETKLTHEEIMLSALDLFDSKVNTERTK